MSSSNRLISQIDINNGVLSVAVDYEVVTNKNLSWAARGLFAYLCAKSNANLAEMIVADVTEKYTGSTYTALQELQRAGLVKGAQ